MFDDDPVTRAAVGDADGAIDHIEQLTDWDRGRTRRVRALVLPAVGDHDSVAGGHERVEQELAVLQSSVMVAHLRGAEEEVVAVSRTSAREDLVVEAEQADHSVWDRAHRHSVQMVRWPVRKFARVGRPRRRSARSARTSAELQGRRSRLAARRRLARTSARRFASSLALPGVAGRRGRQGVRGLEDHVSPHVERLGFGESVERIPESVDQLRDAARKVDVGTADIVERQNAAHELTVDLGRRNPDKDAVQAGLPGASGDRSRRNGWRCGASSPHRIPEAATHPSQRGRRRHRRAGSADGPAPGRPDPTPPRR